MIVIWGKNNSRVFLFKMMHFSILHTQRRNNMAYHFAKEADVKETNKWCVGILNEVQTIVKDYFTFSYELIGSGGNRLVTYNDGNPFDLDYNIFIQKDKQHLIQQPDQIKDIFFKAFQKAFGNGIEAFNPSSYTKINNSKSVITVKNIEYGNLAFSFDVAILRQHPNGYLEKIIFDKKNNRYIWNQVKDSKDLNDKVLLVKQRLGWNAVRERYLDLKNDSLSNNDETKSFSIFIQVINEFYQKLK